MQYVRTVTPVVKTAFPTVQSFFNVHTVHYTYIPPYCLSFVLNYSCFVAVYVLLMIYCTALNFEEQNLFADDHFWNIHAAYYFSANLMQRKNFARPRFCFSASSAKTQNWSSSKIKCNTISLHSVLVSCSAFCPYGLHGVLPSYVRTYTSSDWPVCIVYVYVHTYLFQIQSNWGVDCLRLWVWITDLRKTVCNTEVYNTCIVNSSLFAKKNLQPPVFGNPPHRAMKLWYQFLFS